MVKRMFVAALLVLSMSGCCLFSGKRDSETAVSIDSYKDALVKIRSNVASIRSDVQLITYNEKLKKAHLDVFDATVALCDDTLNGKKAAGDK